MRVQERFLQSLSLSLAAGGFVGIVLTPLELAIPSVVITFLVSMATLSMIFNSGSMDQNGEVIPKVLRRWVATNFGIAGLATVGIVFLPIIVSSPISLMDSLFGGGITSIVRCTLVIYMTSFFPGYVIVNSFWNEEQNVYIRILLSIILSIVITSLIGATLVSLGFFSTFSFLSLLWIIISLPSLVSSKSLLSIRTERIEVAHHEWKIKALFLVSTCLYLIVPSYIISVFRSPVSGIMAGDVNVYAIFASNFIDLTVPFEAPYVGFTPYLLTISALTGLPFGYSWVVSQFILLSIPLSVYFISRTLMNDETRSMFAVLFIVIMQGLSGITMLGMALANPTVWMQYLEGNSYGVINDYIYSTIGWGFATLPIGLGLMTGWIEISFLLTALAFGIKYIKWGSLKDGLVSGLFVAYMILFHNIFLVTLYVAILFLFSLFIGHSMVRVGKGLVVSALILIPIDLVNRQWFTYYIFNRLFLPPSVFILVGTCILLLILVSLNKIETREVHIFLFIPMRLRKYDLRSRLTKVKESSSGFIQHMDFRSRVFLAAALFLLVVTEIMIEFGTFHITDAWENIKFIYPWWVFMTRYVFQIGIIIVLAPYILRTSSCSSDIRAFAVSWIVATIPLAVAPLLAPTLLVPAVWTNRMLMLLIIPLSFIAADGIVKFTQKCDLATGIMCIHSRTRQRNLAGLVLIGMIAFSASTFSLAVQFRFVAPDMNIIPSSEAASWIQIHSQDLPVLTIAENTQLQLAALSTSHLISSTKHLTYSLTLQEALRSMSAAELEILGRFLGNFFVYLPYGDMHLVNNTNFEHWISEQQLVYEDSSGRVYLSSSQDMKPEVGLWPIGNSLSIIRNLTTVEHVSSNANASSEEAYFWIKAFEGETTTLNLTPIYCMSSEYQPDENESLGLYGWSGAADTLEIIGRDVEYKGHLIVINGLLEIPFPLTGNNQSVSLKVSIPSITGNLIWNSSYINSYSGESLSGQSIEIQEAGEYLVVISEQYTKSNLPEWQLEPLITTGVRINGPFPIGGCYSWIVETEHEVSIIIRTLRGDIVTSLIVATFILTTAALATVCFPTVKKYRLNKSN